MPHKIREDSSDKPLFYFGKDLRITARQFKIEGSENLSNFLNDQNNFITILPKFYAENDGALPQGNFYILNLKIRNKFRDSQQT